jgi:hypothetical protein
MTLKISSKNKKIYKNKSIYTGRKGQNLLSISMLLGKEFLFSSSGRSDRIKKKSSKSSRERKRICC